MNEEIRTEGNPAANTQPEANGAAAKTFTQEEVNKIVSDRLARERAKQEPQIDTAELDKRERELTAKENRYSCAEYIREKKLNPGLIDILDTSEPENFKQNVDKLLKLYPVLDPQVKRPRFSGSCGAGTVSSASDPIAEAFRGK